MHQIETRNGAASMFYRGEAPWHGLGKKLANPPTVAEGIQAAGLNWTVGLERLRTADGTEVDAYATVRDVDRAVLGVVGPHYRVLQNVEAFNFFDPFLASGQAELHTAGSLCGGRKVWVLCRLALDPIQIVPGQDEVRKYLLLSNGHDGGTSVRVGFTPIRVVCANTLSMAHGGDASKLIRVRHTQSMKANLEAVRDVMNLANQEFEATAEQYRRLAHRHISQADVKKYVRQLFDADEKEAEEGKLSTRRLNQMAEIERLFEAGRGNGLPGVRGTAWAIYNGVTEWLSHERGSNRDRRIDSLWFGDSASLNAKALELALAL